MKNLFFGLVTIFALLAFAGCYNNGTSNTHDKSSKCGTGKCGNAK